MGTILGVLIKWAAKQHLASASADPLSDLGMKMKRQERKDEEDEKARSSISARTPKSSVDRRRELIVLTSTCESDLRQM